MSPREKTKIPFAESVSAVAAMFLDVDPQKDPALKGAVDDITKVLAKYKVPPAVVSGVAVALDLGALFARGRPLRMLDQEGRRRFLRLLEKLPLSRNPLWVSSLIYKLTYYLQEPALKPIGMYYGIPVAKHIESQRWHSQIQRAQETDADVELEAEVIVVGTGAGGAVAAYELASRGIAVAMVEAGDFYHRAHFDGRYLDALDKMYRNYPLLGNGFAYVLAGRTVGGSTTINSGTCFRTPDSVLEKWRAGGLSDLTPANLAPHFDMVERMIGVEEATAETVGPLFDYVSKGAHSLGFTDVHRLRRNAQGCDGQGLCQYGCPTAAKRSMDVTFVPAALEAGAYLYSGFRVNELMRQGSRVEGVSAVGRRADGSRVRLTIKAPNVIMAMGTMQTPLFMMQQGISNPHLGRHLTIHPAGAVAAVFDGVDFRNQKTIPQGIGIGDLAHQGIRFEGGTPPHGVYNLALRLNGQRFRELADSFVNTAFLGHMICDKSEGRIRTGVGDYPVVTYWVNPADVHRFGIATATSARMFFRAGAKKVILFTYHGKQVLTAEHEVDAFLQSNWKARHFNMSAYHPLGTARLAPTPEEGVCDPDHRVFGFEGLYVMDGSNVPSSLGVNPQITIMTLASRAARRLAERLAGGVTVAA